MARYSDFCQLYYLRYFSICVSLSLLGLDFAGNKTLSINELKQNRAKEKVLYMVPLVQGTSSLEQQGLDSEDLDLLTKQAEYDFLHKYRKNL